MRDQLYHQAILDLARQSGGTARLEQPQASATVDNPLCGDRVTVDLDLADGRVRAVGHKVRGCLLCQAAAAVIAARAPGADGGRAARSRRAAGPRHPRGPGCGRGPLARAQRLRPGASPQEPARLRAVALRGLERSPRPDRGRHELKLRERRNLARPARVGRGSGRAPSTGFRRVPYDQPAKVASLAGRRARGDRRGASGRVRLELAEGAGREPGLRRRSGARSGSQAISTSICR